VVRLEWSDMYRTDIGIVDEQHQQLFSMINAIAQTLEAGDVEPEEVEKALDGLVEYAGQHFVDEEREMVLCHVDSRHQKLQRMEHSSFVYDVGQLRSYANDGGDSLADQYEEILQFTASWLIYHTLRTDQKMAMQVHAIEQGKSPEEAYEYSETHPLSPAIYHEVIEAVVHLWSDALERIADLEHRLKEISGDKKA
jgi:hemerythrin-like metal-binding protein